MFFPQKSSTTQIKCVTNLLIGSYPKENLTKIWEILLQLEGSFVEKAVSDLQQPLYWHLISRNCFYDCYRKTRQKLFMIKIMMITTI